MTKGKNEQQAGDATQDSMKEMLADELKRRKRTKGTYRRNISALSGISPENAETHSQKDIWGAEAGAQRNMEAEAQQHLKETREKEAKDLRSQEEMLQDHRNQWEELETKQQQEVSELDQTQKTEINQLQQEQAQARHALAEEQSSDRQERKAEYKAQMQIKKPEFKKKKKQAWTEHLNKSEIKHLRQQQLQIMQEVSTTHEEQRELLSQQLVEDINELEAQQSIELDALLNQQQQELQNVQPEDEQQLKEQHALQVLELTEMHKQQKGDVRTNYIYNRNELVATQNAEIAEIKSTHKQQLRDLANPKQVLQDYHRTVNQEIKSLTLNYHAFLDSQITESIEQKATHLENMNIMSTRHFRAVTEMYKKHEGQKEGLSQNQSQERKALGYVSSSPFEIPTVDPKPNNNSNDEDEYDNDSSYNFKF